MNKITKKISDFISYASIFYAILSILFWLLAGTVMYPAPKPATYQKTANIQTLIINKNEKIATKYLKNPNAEYTILFSHGNSEDLGTIDTYLQLLYKSGYSVFAYDYRGYGLSDGKASENNTYEDILTSYNYLTKTLKIPGKNIIALGRSIGTGPSVELAKEKKIGALILESGFISAYSVFTRFQILMGDKYQNLKKLKKIDTPTLFIHGKKDTIIPLWHAKKLYQTSNGPKDFYWVEGADHNNLLYFAQIEYFKRINQFIDEKVHQGN